MRKIQINHTSVQKLIEKKKSTLDAQHLNEERSSEIMASHHLVECDQAVHVLATLVVIVTTFECMRKLLSELQSRAIGGGQAEILGIFWHAEFDRRDCIDVEVVAKEDRGFRVPHGIVLAPGEGSELLLHLHLHLEFHLRLGLGVESSIAAGRDLRVGV